MNNKTTPEPLPDEAPNPPRSGEESFPVSREPTTSRQWLAIAAVACLLLAMFIFMHGANIW